MADKTKLTPAHRFILTHMARGTLLMTSSTAGLPWLNKVPGNDPRQPGLYRRVQSGAVAALRRREYIALASTPNTPWWRRDYAITDLGRQALEEDDGREKAQAGNSDERAE